ncbi:hypothetical protein BDW22DRAFT_1360374 [Trametopsis cervina]|nr:hypothetical protein BDW22DRAFT_1360374 [Trametopsis cervina]
MRVSIQEQVTFNISFYLDELTKMLDSQGVRQLAETIEAVRATAQEQVPYNTENHLTDFCKNLAPEMLQLFQEIKEKAEEKSRLDRQIDILRRHKHDYEAGDLRGDEFADAPPPPPIHVSRSDADLHKAWRGRRKNDGAGGFMYPDPEWTHDTFDNAPPDVGAGGGLIAPPLDAASFYRQ